MPVPDARIAWGGVLLLGITTLLGSPKLRSKARSAHGATGITYTSGVFAPGVRAKVDPARGVPA